MPSIRTVLCPPLLPLTPVTDAIVVIIDILRATSAICTGLHHGVEAIIPVASIEDALAYRGSGHLLAGERNAQALEGFDFGNSPFAFMADEVVGQSIVFTTTNGTQALEQARKAGAEQIVCGAFVNLTALAAYLATQERDVVMFCAGWRDAFNLEDTLFAGALAEALAQTHKSHTIEDDATLAAMRLYDHGRTDLFEYIKASSHFTRLARQGIEEDIRYCLTPDSGKAIPILQGDALVALAA